MQIGMMTFHASYNFGSVWQAFSLQYTVNSLGYNCEIINYRMKSQKNKYSLFPVKEGWKLALRSFLLLKHINGKRQANRKYENFINTKLKLSEEINYVEQLKSFANRYDVYLAGSDQIWGYDIPEFISSNEDSRSPYFLSFTDGYKVSYASSTGIATFNELMLQQENLKKISHIAVRETRGKELVQQVVGKEVEVTLDPTYLIQHEDWLNIAEEYSSINLPPKYVLIYSLQGVKKRKKWLQLIDAIHLNHPEYMFVTVAPFAPIIGKGIINQASAGPGEILHFFAHAAYVFTDTFHGMSFSIHMRKNFFSF